VRGWLRERFGTGRRPAAAVRWVVVDCETSGLDAKRDSLISVAGVGVRGGRIPPGDLFAAMLRQDRPSGRENILVHGIGRERQVSGEAPQAALDGFLAFAADSPRVAYRAPFDKAMISRAARAVHRREDGVWLDLAELLPVLFPQPGGREEATLEQWLAAFGIAHPSRHDALGDAYATAQLFQVALSEALRQDFRTVGTVFRAARAGRWMGN
jgi:DNA polymerase-3 subunit epsilon